MKQSSTGGSSAALGSVGNSSCLHQEFCKVDITLVLTWPSIWLSQILGNAGGSRRTDCAVGSGQGACHPRHSAQDNQHGMSLHNHLQKMIYWHISRLFWTLDFLCRCFKQWWRKVILPRRSCLPTRILISRSTISGGSFRTSTLSLLAIQSLWKSIVI